MNFDKNHKTRGVLITQMQLGMFVERPVVIKAFRLEPKANLGGKSRKCGTCWIRQ